MTERTTVFVGCDLGDKLTDVCVLDDAGNVVQEVRVRSTAAGMGGFFRSIRSARIVMEVGTNSRWMDALARSLGHEVILANPRRVKLISQRNVKTDRSDAELLARLGRADPTLLAPVTHRGAETQADLVQLRTRACLVRARTLLVNHVRGVVKCFGARVRKCEVEAFHRVALEFIPEGMLPGLRPVLDQIAALTAQVKALDHWIERDACQRYETQGSGGGGTQTRRPAPPSLGYRRDLPATRFHREDRGLTRKEIRAGPAPVTFARMPRPGDCVPGFDHSARAPAAMS